MLQAEGTEEDHKIAQDLHDSIDDADGNQNTDVVSIIDPIDFQVSQDIISRDGVGSKT